MSTDIPIKTSRRIQDKINIYIELQKAKLKTICFRKKSSGLAISNISKYYHAAILSAITKWWKGSPNNVNCLLEYGNNDIPIKIGYW